jgi:hypothetical protein
VARVVEMANVKKTTIKPGKTRALGKSRQLLEKELNYFVTE